METGIDIAVLFCELKYFESALLGYVVGASGLNGIVRHVAELDAPVVFTEKRSAPQPMPWIKQ